MDIKKWQIAGALFTLILGTILHFTYNWSGKNPVIGIFSAVNESIWEHLKLLAFPMLLFSALEFLAYGKNLTNFVPVKMLSILAGMLAIVVLFYTYTGIIGKNYFIADILIFVIGVFLSHFISYRLLQTTLFSSCLMVIAGWLGLVGLVTLFALFTYAPPRLELFRDPLIQN